MNTNPHDHLHDLKASESVLSPAEETLRLIASLPAPVGLENRVNAALSSAPRRGGILVWPRTLGLTLRPESGWMRTAAAAAIVFVVAGGGWGVYSRVEQSHFAGEKILMPAPGGFSGAGAIRTPVTLPGPAVPQRAKISPPKAKAAKKPVASRKSTFTSTGHGNSSATGAPEN
jgi:hypothetical protein